jgi:hyperosmotically inducible protein
MKKFTIFSIVAVFAMALVGCSTTANTNTNSIVKTNTNVMANSNVAVVVNNNSNMAMNSNMMNSNVSRTDYDRERAKYEANKGASTIGQGANDSWLWFKTKSALATTNDLRDSTINVDVTNDVVTLRGTVASKAESDKAASVAKGIDGVKSVTNQLKVQAGDSMTNQMTSDGAKTGNTNANKR